MNEKTLTAEQCSKLSLYILMTTKTREGEAATWEKLAEEKKEDGSPKYIHAADNAQFWRELDADLREILGLWRREHGQLSEYHGEPGGARSVPRLYPGNRNAVGRGFSPALLLLVLGGGLRRLPPLGAG